MTNVFLVRHGQRADSSNGFSLDMGHIQARPADPDITTTGEEQASETGARLAKENLSAIYASPFLRTVHTASIIAKSCNLPVYLDWGLGEWFRKEWWSSWPGTIPSEVLMRMFPCIDQKRMNFSGFFPTLGEDGNQVSERYSSTIKCLSSLHEGQNIAMISHGGAIISAPWELAKVESLHFFLCGVTKLVRDSENWSVEYLNDASHLTCVES